MRADIKKERIVSHALSVINRISLSQADYTFAATLPSLAVKRS
jgi:hypothetical protein